MSTDQRHLPLPEEPDLVKHYEYLYERSAGCVGVLKDWLHQALTVSLEQDHQTLTLKDLERCAKSPQKLLRFAREIKEGEALIEEREALMVEFRSILGIRFEQDIQPEVPNANSRVGKRNPQRDEVGQ